MGILDILIYIHLCNIYNFHQHCYLHHQFKTQELLTEKSCICNIITVYCAMAIKCLNKVIKILNNPIVITSLLLLLNYKQTNCFIAIHQYTFISKFNFAGIEPKLREICDELLGPGYVKNRKDNWDEHIVVSLYYHIKH